MEEEVVEIFKDIKKLLVLGLLKQGSTAEDIGKVLGVSSRTIERLVSPSPGRKQK